MIIELGDAGQDGFFQPDQLLIDAVGDIEEDGSGLVGGRVVACANDLGELREFLVESDRVVQAVSCALESGLDELLFDIAEGFQYFVGGGHGLLCAHPQRSLTPLGNLIGDAAEPDQSEMGLGDFGVDLHEEVELGDEIVVGYRGVGVFDNAELFLMYSTIDIQAHFVEAGRGEGAGATSSSVVLSPGSLMPGG